MHSSPAQVPPTVYHHMFGWSKTKQDIPHMVWTPFSLYCVTLVSSRGNMITSIQLFYSNLSSGLLCSFLELTSIKLRKELTKHWNSYNEKLSNTLIYNFNKGAKVSRRNQIGLQIASTNIKQFVELFEYFINIIHNILINKGQIIL